MLPEKIWENCEKLRERSILINLNFEENSNRIKIVKDKLSNGKKDKDFIRELKSNLCNAFVKDKEISWEDLSQISKDYTLKLYDHIKKSNNLTTNTSLPEPV